MDDWRFCKKCLLKDMPEAEYFKNLYEYIEHLDPDSKVSEEVYEERLGACRECDQLLAGMCRVCGCYVELRAAMKGKECPEGVWERRSFGGPKEPKAPGGKSAASGHDSPRPPKR